MVDRDKEALELENIQTVNYRNTIDDEEYSESHI